MNAGQTIETAQQSIGQQATATAQVHPAVYLLAKAVTVSELAAALSAGMVTDTRNDGSKFVKFVDGIKDYGVDSFDCWVSDLCRQAHGDKFPDDQTYRFIETALDIIADCADDADDVTDMYERIDADIYNSDLLAWMASHSSRVGYVDDVISKYGGQFSGGIINVIQTAQAREREEVLTSVYESLVAESEERCNAIDSARYDEDED